MAKEKLRAYRKYLHQHADEEFQAIAAGYEAIAKGRRLSLGLVLHPRQDAAVLLKHVLREEDAT